MGMRGVLVWSTLLLLLLLLLPGSGSGNGTVPVGWMLEGSHPGDIDIATDRTVVHGGRASVRLRSTAAGGDHFGSLEQSLNPNPYRRRRMRFSCFLRAAEVSAWAGLWMRVDGTDVSLAYDTMSKRPLKGTSSWAWYQVAVDVYPEAAVLYLGVFLFGPGTLWVDDCALEALDGKGPIRQQPPAPPNLSFEEETPGSGPSPGRIGSTR